MNITPHLLEQARRGDETAQATIIAHLLPGIRRIAAGSIVPGLEREDAEQEGLIALFRAIESYRPQAEVSFETYAMRCVRNGISDARLRAGRKKHQPLNHSVPLEDESRAVPGPEEQAVDKEQYRTTVRILRTGLTPTERRVLLLRLDGCDYRTIARRLGVSPKAVDNALTRVRAKLKNRREL